MKRQDAHALLLAASAVVVVMATSMALAQNAAPPSLKDQLEAQYKLAKIGYSSGQPTITEPGTVLVIQKGGILGSPPGNFTLCPATFKDGSLNPPGRLASALCGNEAHQLPSGEKVYVTKIDVNPKKDKVSLRIIECDSCNGAAQPSSYKSDVVFEFPKGSLGNPNVTDIEDTIAKVFMIDNSAPATDTPQAPDQPGQPGVQPPTPPQPPPVIQVGQSIDDVVATQGQPDKIVDLGTKKIYVYKDLKITFVNGKVSDVQ